MECDAAELWIDDDEIFRQSAVAQQTAVLVGQRRCAVQPICEIRDIAVCDPLIRSCIASQRLGTGQGTAIYDSDTGDVQPIENPVEQGRISAGARDVECVEDSVFENVRLIEFN